MVVIPRATVVTIVAPLAITGCTFAFQVAPAVPDFLVFGAVPALSIAKAFFRPPDALAAISSLRGKARSGQHGRANNRRYCQVTKPHIHKSPLPFL
jgi:hypothetical protein